MKIPICQSCGMPMKEEKHFGKNSDNSKNEEYCCFCFPKGKFSDEGITLQGKIDKNAGFAVKMGMNERQARELAGRILPRLKRWNKF